MPIREYDMALGTNGDRCQTHTHARTHTGVPHKCTRTLAHTLALAPAQRTYHIHNHTPNTSIHTRAHTHNVRSICVREGLDVVAQCREQEKNPKKFDFIGNTDYTEIDYLDANKKQRVGNGRWCNSPVMCSKCTFVCLYISVS